MIALDLFMRATSRSVATSSEGRTSVRTSAISSYEYDSPRHPLMFASIATASGDDHRDEPTNSGLTTNDPHSATEEAWNCGCTRKEQNCHPADKAKWPLSIRLTIIGTGGVVAWLAVLQLARLAARFVGMAG